MFRIQLLAVMLVVVVVWGDGSSSIMFGIQLLAVMVVVVVVWGGWQQ